MRVGILTFHHSNYNYGAVLQAYSMYKLIESLGFETYIINYTPGTYTFRKRIAAKIVALLGFEFEKFRHKHIPNILHKTNSYEELKDLNKIIDAFSVGSDQVWRLRKDTDSMFNYFLDFVDDDKIKISYAASFGLDFWEGEETLTPKIKTLLNRFDAISVREKSGIKICKNVFERESVNTLDPTLVIHPKLFHELTKEKYRPKNRKRKLVYMLLNDSKQNESFFKKVASQNNLKFERISGKKILSKKNFYFFRSVNYWLTQIKHADLVVTDSFHCTVFSIIFKRKFVCLANKYRGITRIESLLKPLDLEARLLKDINQFDIKNFLVEIEYQKVESTLQRERQASIKFLKRNLKPIQSNN